MKLCFNLGVQLGFHLSVKLGFGHLPSPLIQRATLQQVAQPGMGCEHIHQRTLACLALLGRGENSADKHTDGDAEPWPSFLLSFE